MKSRILEAVIRVCRGSGRPGAADRDTGTKEMTCRANTGDAGQFAPQLRGNNLITRPGRRIVCGSGGKRMHTGTGTWIKITALLTVWALQRAKAANQC